MASSDTLADLVTQLRRVSDDLDRWTTVGIRGRLVDIADALDALPAEPRQPLTLVNDKEESACPLCGGVIADGACGTCRVSDVALTARPFGTGCHHCDEQGDSAWCWWCGRRGTGQDHGHKPKRGQPIPESGAMPPVQVGDVVLWDATVEEERAEVIETQHRADVVGHHRARMLALYRDPLWTREPS